MVRVFVHFMYFMYVLLFLTLICIQLCPGFELYAVFSEVLLAKLPDQFSVHFRREGVLHQVTETLNCFAFIDNGEYFDVY
jgi:hypothetical protein